LAELNELLFVGLYHEDGAEMWTFDGSSSWQQVIGPDPEIPPYSGVYFPSLYDQSLFVVIRSGVWYRIWFTRDGETWRESGLSSSTSIGQGGPMGTALDVLFRATGTRLWRQAPVFTDAFEAGDLSAWDRVVP
jgi:hypothetical protein